MAVAYIIGGGPSLKGFDFSRLQGRETFGVNLAAEHASTKYLVSIDRNFCFNFAPLIASFGGRAHVAPVDAGLTERFPEAQIYTRTKGGELLSPDPSSISGLNSGFAAFALAVRMGFKRIALLGIDGNDAGNWHKGYNWGGSPQKVVDAWVRQFDESWAECFELGLEVTNYSPDSAVSAFPKRQLSELI